MQAFVKMGFKTWTRGQQKGLRVYTASINELSKILNIPSLKGLCVH